MLIVQRCEELDELKAAQKEVKENTKLRYLYCCNNNLYSLVSVYEH